MSQVTDDDIMALRASLTEDLQGLQQSIEWDLKRAATRLCRAQLVAALLPRHLGFDELKAAVDEAMTVVGEE